MTIAYSPIVGEERHASNVDGLGKDFLCAKCEAPVGHVSAYTIRAGDPDLERWVGAYFRLRAGSNHEEDCEYRPLGQVRALVASSRAVEDAADPFQDIDGGTKFEFRLSIPTELTQQQLPQMNTKEQYKEAINRVWSGREIAPYCRSATGLAKLWRAIEDAEGRAELRDAMKVVGSRGEIGWDEFFFGTENYAKLARKLKNRSMWHPAAVLVHIRDSGTTKAGLPMVRCSAQIANTQRNSFVSVQVFGDSNVLDLLKVGKHYIIYGDWRFLSENNWKPAGVDRERKYQNIAITLHQAAQVSEVDLPEVEPDA